MENNENIDTPGHAECSKESPCRMKQMCCRRAASLCKTIVLVGLGAFIALACVQCCRMHNLPKP
ncbi:MAG: hypothetical protein IKK45_05930 [Akkermansia sp.]|nr:hypothetical protein [Akkermansia sp.]